MSIWEKRKEFPDESEDQPQSEGQDQILDDALRNFKLSVDTWSETAYSTRRVAPARPHRNWRPVAAWALGCALVASSVSGVVYQRHEEQVRAAQAAAKLAAQQKQAAEQQALNEEELLASVDSDVSRQVPSAMEPLAQMADDDTQ